MNGEVTSTALAQYEHGGQVPTTSGGGMPAIMETMDALKAVRTFVSKEFKRDLDFGVIPGTGKKSTLLLPGAQKACMYFNCYAEFDVTTHEYGNGHAEYQVKAILVSRSTGMRVGSGVGLCSTMESKYRFHNSARSCPECGAEAIIKGKAEFGGGWLCYRNKGGCGFKFIDGDPTIEGQTGGKVENPNPHDTRNTALKMGKKRALVDAAMGLGCLSELFTQDLEDVYDIRPTAAEPEPEAADDRPQAPPSRPAGPTSRNQPIRSRPEPSPSGGGRQHDGPPRSGSALFAWIKRREDETGADLLKPLNAWAKISGFSYKMTTWTAEEVAQGYNEALRLLESRAVPAGAPVNEDADDPGDDPF